MAFGKWIGAFIGGLSGGILGSLAGYAIGSIVDSLLEVKAEDGVSADNGSGGQYGNATSAKEQAGERNGFLFSLLVLSAHVMRADGKIMHSEMNYLRVFLRQSFGEAAVAEGESIILRLFEYRKEYGEAMWDSQFRQACDEMRAMMPEEQRIQLIAYLCEIAKADGNIHPSEVDVLRLIASLLGMSAAIVEQFLALGGSTIDDAYRVLGVSPSASDDEVRKAYRDLVRKNHPDRVATLGDDVREAAKKKMQEINDAKERIYKARGM